MRTPTNCPYCGQHTRFQVEFGAYKRCGRCGSLWTPVYRTLRPMPWPVKTITWAGAKATVYTTRFWTMMRDFFRHVWRLIRRREGE